jgi:probable phosphoglycerate mutase
MTTRVYLVRHGATPLIAEDRFAGSTDVELSEEGHTQATRLGERLASEPISVVFASPMKRTVSTARCIADPHGLTIATDDGLREIDHGRWEGLTRAEVESRFPEEYAAWDRDPFTFAPDGGEPGVQVMARALPALRRIVAANLGKAIVVVSHKATIRLLLCALLGIEGRGYRDRLDQHPACLNALDFKDLVRVRLVTFNDVSHYKNAPAATGPRLSKWFDETMPPRRG